MPSKTVDIIAPASNGMSAPIRNERKRSWRMGGLGKLTTLYRSEVNGRSLKNIGVDDRSSDATLDQRNLPVLLGFSDGVKNPRN